jgi:hypothetical protein
MLTQIILKDPNDEVEVCTVKQLIGKRNNPINGKPEYLVRWMEYPEADTWESLENL